MCRLTSSLCYPHFDPMLAPCRHKPWLPPSLAPASNRRTAEPPNLRTVELAPVVTVLWALKVPDLSLDIVLSLEIGAVVAASRCLLPRPGTGMALPTEGESVPTAEGGAKTPSKRGCANPSAGHGRTRWVMNDARYAAAPLRKISRRVDWRLSATSRGAADIKVLSRCLMAHCPAICF